MRFGKILLMGLMAACLMGASSRAWDEGNTICPGDGGAEAEQIRIFYKELEKGLSHGRGTGTGICGH